MNKKFLVFGLFFCFTAFSSYAQFKFYNDGVASVIFSGTTKDTTLKKVYEKMWNTHSTQTSQSQFDGKLSKVQSRLLWQALSEYDYAPGEIYSVAMMEYDRPIHTTIILVVRIEKDGSCTWKGIERW